MAPPVPAGARSSDRRPARDRCRGPRGRSEPGEGHKTRERGLDAVLPHERGRDALLPCQRRRARGTELWKSDGTAAGTVLVKDILAGRRHFVSPVSHERGRDALLQCLRRHERQRALEERRDGRRARVLVKDKFRSRGKPSPFLSSVSHERGRDALFRAYDGTSGRELLEERRDGRRHTSWSRTSSREAALRIPSMLTNVGGTLFFSAYDGMSGTELWKSDGTAGGTVLVKDINTGSYGSNPRSLTNMGGTLFFQAATTARAATSSGKATGRRRRERVKDIRPGS